MHHWAMNSVKGSSESRKLGSVRSYEQPVCPKPRRVGCSVPEFLRPVRCNKHNQGISDGRTGILNIISDQALDAREPPCTGCLPRCYAGSPPGRTGNPLIYDARFVHQMELGPPPV